MPSTEHNNNLVSQVMNSAQNLPIYWNVGTGFQTTLRALVGCFDCFDNFDCFDCSKVQIFMMFFRQELMVKSAFYKSSVEIFKFGI